MRKCLIGMIIGFFTALLGMNAMGQTQSIILDVRTAEEFLETRVIGARNLDWFQPNFKDEIAKLDKTASYKLYCRSGNRSGQATQLMKSMGFKYVENLGSVSDASQKLKIACEGRKAC